MPHAKRVPAPSLSLWKGAILLVLTLGCSSVSTREKAVGARLAAAAVQCADRDTVGARDTTAIYGAAFEADGFVRATPSPRDRFHLDHPGQEVAVEFVVDTAGRADLCLAHVIRETEPGLGDRLLDAASRWTFTPAEYQGKKVRQVVRVTYTARRAN